MNPALKDAIRQQRHNVFGRRRYWFHIIIWLLVLLFLGTALAQVFNGNVLNMKISINELSSDKLSGLLHNKWLIVLFLCTSCLMAAMMVYFLLLYIVPYARYRKRKRFLWLGMVLGILIWVGSLVILGIWIGSFYPASEKNDFPIISTIAAGLGISLSFTITSYFYSFYYFIDLYDQQQHLNEYQQVFTLRLQAETNFLQTQINPHFLFNTLNNIYSLTLKESPDAPVITRRLKELMSYMLEDFSRETVMLQEEIRFLQNYVELEQLRNKEGMADIQFRVSGDSSGKQIAPLLLVNFIENAFKHGVKSGIDRSFVHIHLDISGKKLSLNLRNSRQKTERKGIIVHKGGIGIRNVKRRLELLYPGCHKLRIRRSAAAFHIHLQIKLQS